MEETPERKEPASAHPPARDEAEAAGRKKLYALFESIRILGRTPVGVARSWVWARRPTGATIEVLCIVVGTAISIAQWQKIGENDEATSQSLQAIKRTADATAKIADQMRDSTSVMERQLTVMQSTSAARLYATFEPFTPGEDSLRMKIVNDGATVAREVQVFNSEAWFEEPPLAMGSMNPPPPFDIEAHTTIPYTYKVPNYSINGKTVRAISDIPEGYQLRFWYSLWWLNAFGDSAETRGCYLWINAKSWEPCEPPKALDWVRIYKQNGLSDEDAKKQAALAVEAQGRREREMRARKSIKDRR